MKPLSEPREIWHAVRRAVRYGRHPGQVWHGAHAVRHARKVKVARGRAEFRDRCARFRGQDTGNAASPPSLERRLERFVTQRYRALIASRGGETVISEKDGDVRLWVQHRSHGLTFLRAEGWRHYSRAYGARKASLAYLCGIDDNGRWAVRVPGTVRSVPDALEAITPAEVRRARFNGRQVLRQGDVYLIESRVDNFAALHGTRHAWDAEARLLRHLDEEAPHGPLQVPFRAKAVMQTVLRMGRLSGRRTRFGD